MDEFLTIPEPSRKQLEEKELKTKEEKARDYVVACAEITPGEFDTNEAISCYLSGYDEGLIDGRKNGHASRDAEVAQLKDLLERAKWPIENYERIRSFMFREGQGPQWSEAWLADYERMEKGGRG